MSHACVKLSELLPVANGQWHGKLWAWCSSAARVAFPPHLQVLPEVGVADVPQLLIVLRRTSARI